MGSIDKIQKPHAVFIPYPAQGHINPMLNLAKLLYHRGFHVTFVNTKYNHSHFLRSHGASSLDGLPSFQFRTILDEHQPCSLWDLLERLDQESVMSGSPPVSCLVSDSMMSFTLDATEKVGMPNVLLWTASACSFMGYMQHRSLVNKGLTPLKDASYLDTIIEWIPGMKNIRLRDLPSFILSTDPNDRVRAASFLEDTERAKRASAIVFNTLDGLEHQVLDALKALLPPIYTLGPLHLLREQLRNDNTRSIGSSLWKEELDCLQWLDSKPLGSVMYVSFGSSTRILREHLVEFAWGFANSGKTFLWVIRPDLVDDKAILPPELLAAASERILLKRWCPQEQVLSHPAVGGFLTHSGWNSTIESIAAGVPMLCWPFFAEQPTNCRYSCAEWGIGMEIDQDVKRDEVERQVRELMEGMAGKEMKRKAMEWKEMAQEATRPSGSSCLNLDKVIDKVLLLPRRDYVAVAQERLNLFGYWSAIVECIRRIL